MLRPDLAPWVEAGPPGLLRASLCPDYVIYPARVSAWPDPALVLPPVTIVEDGEEVAKLLEGRFAHLRAQWATTKAKLLEDRLLRGLNYSATRFLDSRTSRSIPAADSALRWKLALQRKTTLANGWPTHAHRHQAVTGQCRLCWPERPLYEVVWS